MSSRSLVGPMMLLLASVLLGCGPTKPVRVPVHGEVFVNGQPADGGVVRFEPIGNSDGPGRASATLAIVDGKYLAQTAGGLQEGLYRVEVEVRRKTGKKIKQRVVGEMIEVDETAVVSSPRHAGKDSPLEYTAQGGKDTRFDIDIPKQ